MKLTKQEQAVVIGTFLKMIGAENVSEKISPEKLDLMIPIFDELEDNTTPRQKREASMSLLEKFIDDFLMTNA
ncbi:hypothetical protein BMBtpLA2_50 [Bacillus phage vB_BtS_BMBtp14]|uniref:Phage protein n=3 Tax=root TaxID=1 RepID=A0A1B1P7D2_9CAUD|nr:hypothetical protein [Bacillus thuringiensis]YP_009830704.1 hypothetical protein HWA95_gp50 [Bacillus phage vB_BtS_BMBtp14]ANT40010.1 hypothetical protein BMBtpLA2_50 [Bacillus phage vB_BtS_BMBtp14]EEM55892.1 hypothetical protein bthur0007_63520 [Bacillus thuringiensis serovar monterrey BGSC 4AJ1]OTX09758.1 hypothetical protein BK705_04015 [Bacillus thuringiensis serovar monterrey]OTX56329.1 hypothetical protein BK724_00240 [Bacillus thuringiensis serovar sooncheon]